jgi:hypothetical protein
MECVANRKAEVNGEGIDLSVDRTIVVEVSLSQGGNGSEHQAQQNEQSEVQFQGKSPLIQHGGR